MVVVDTIIYFILEIFTILLYMTKLGLFVTNSYSIKKHKNILLIQECKGPKFIGMAQNIQDLPFSENSVKKVSQRRVV